MKVANLFKLNQVHQPCLPAQLLAKRDQAASKQATPPKANDEPRFTGFKESASGRKKGGGASSTKKRRAALLAATAASMDSYEPLFKLDADGNVIMESESSLSPWSF